MDGFLDVAVIGMVHREFDFSSPDTFAFLKIFSRNLLPLGS